MTILIAAVNAGVKMHQQAGAKMRHGVSLARRKWSLAARMTDLLGGAKRSSPKAA